VIILSEDDVPDAVRTSEESEFGGIGHGNSLLELSNPLAMTRGDGKMVEYWADSLWLRTPVPFQDRCNSRSASSPNRFSAYR
jgi:hypothetical protein